jgi:hypothetical protein
MASSYLNWWHTRHSIDGTRLCLLLSKKKGEYRRIIVWAEYSETGIVVIEVENEAGMRHIEAQWKSASEVA